MAAKTIDPRFYTVYGRALADPEYKARLMSDQQAEREAAFEEVFEAGITDLQRKTLNDAVEYLKRFEQAFGGDIRPCT